MPQSPFHRPPPRGADSDPALCVGVCSVVGSKRDEFNEVPRIVHGVDESVGGPALTKGNGVHASKVPVLRIARPARIGEHRGNDLRGQQNQNLRIAPERVQVLRGRTSEGVSVHCSGAPVAKGLQKRWPVDQIVPTFPQAVPDDVVLVVAAEHGDVVAVVDEFEQLTRRAL